MNEPTASKTADITEIPAGWERKSVGEIFTNIQSGGTPKRGVDRFYDGSIPFVKIQDLTRQKLAGIRTAEESVTAQAINENATRLFHPGTLLLTIYATLGETALVKAPVATNQAILGLSGADASNVVYIKYALEHERTRLASLSRQTTQANIGKEIVSRYSLVVPPLNEQRKIASVLYTLDRLIENTARHVNVWRRIEKGTRHWILRHGMRDQPQKKVRVQSQTVTVPESWEMVPLAEIARAGARTFTDGDWVESADMVEDGPVQLIQLKHIGEGRFVGECDRFVSEEFVRREGCTKVEKGDLLISRMAEPILRTIRVPEFERDSITAVDVVVAKVDTERWSPEFIKAVLNSKAWQDLGRAFASGSTRLRISRSNMERIGIPHPPLDEQEEIGELLGRIDASVRAAESYKENLLQLKKGLMQDLLSGRVRTDEKAIEVIDEVAAYG